MSGFTSINVIGPTPGPIASRYYAGEYFNGASASTLAISANTLYAQLLRIGFNATWTKIGVEVTSSAVGKSARLGIFSANTDGTPNALVLDAGTISVAATGNIEATISQAMPAGYYYAVLVSDGTPTLRAAFSATPLHAVLGVDATGGTPANLQLTRSFTYGVLSGATPFGAVTYSNAAQPLCYLRA